MEVGRVSFSESKLPVTANIQAARKPAQPKPEVWSPIDFLKKRRVEALMCIEEITGEFEESFAAKEGDSAEISGMKARGLEVDHLIQVFEGIKAKGILWSEAV